MYEGELNPAATPVLRDTINVRVAGDQNEANPTDVTVMDVNGTDTVVVTDGINKCVKSFYNKVNQPCHSKLSLDSEPWSLTQLTHSQVTVTVPNNKQIATVEVNPDLKLMSTFTTNKQYLGITALTPSTIAVGSPDPPPSVDILDMSGTVIRSLTPSVNNKRLLHYPYFLCTTKEGNILMSDDGTNSVLCLTPQGDVVFNYSPTGDTVLKNPRGVTVTNTGYILVTDYSLQSGHELYLLADRSPRGVTLRLTESGQFGGHILTFQGVAFGLSRDKHGQLYVSLYYKGEIQVFKG